jgi:membrane carboxypeptidase/penicillin-binding protein PbpC
MLEAEAPRRTQQLYWFVDGELLAAAAPTDPVRWSPVSGLHTIACSDRHGGQHRVRIQVE